MKALSIFLIFPLVPVLAGGDSSPSASCAGLKTPDLAAQSSKQVLPYRMKGKVKLLFFWVGKDNVGGGHITRTLRADSRSGNWVDGVEVLFGSNPDRVPGGINRWGYGREWAYWNSGLDRGRSSLERTVFEGFMRKSDEESLDEVRKGEDRLRQKGQFDYEGIVSTVLPDRAFSQIRRFSAQEDFDFRQPQKAACSFQERMDSFPADEEKDLNNEGHYQQPLGFLTAVREAISEALRLHEQGTAENAEASKALKPLKKARYPYVYNAKPHHLRVTKVKYHDRFKLPLKGADGSKAGHRTFERVAQIHFKAGDAGSKDGHAFFLYIPLQGEFRGLPIRIVDKPRWWLKVQLDLDPSQVEKPASHANESVD